MSYKAHIKPFVPPVLWSAVSRMAKGKSQTKAPTSRLLLETVTKQEFLIKFHRTVHPAGEFFVPVYGAHRPASNAILSGRLFEPDTHELVSRVLAKRPGNMVHAGTFFGDMLPTFSRACPGTLYAFEPVLESFVLAKLCIQANDLENVMLFNAGLGEDLSVARINTGEAGSVHRGGGSKISSRGQLTSLFAIDNLNLSNLSIIQLDVEGHELPALKGAKMTIEKNAPIIMIEDNDRSCDAFLESLGYDLASTIPGLFVWSRPQDTGFLRDHVAD